jgi:hypothetical protein
MSTNTATTVYKSKPIKTIPKSNVEYTVKKYTRQHQPKKVVRNHYKRPTIPNKNVYTYQRPRPSTSVTPTKRITRTYKSPPTRRVSSPRR